MKFRFVSLAAIVIIAGCSLLPAKTQTDLQTMLAGLANKATGDLTTAVSTANTPAPNLPGGVVDQAGATCGTALLAVQAQVNAVLKNANVPAGGGVTAAEVASLMLPGTPQTNAVRDQIVQGCSVKVAQVTQAVAGGAAWFNQLAALFAIQLAPVGA